MNLLLSNDWHFASKNPGSRIDNYNDELFGLLRQLLICARHFTCGAVVVAGDIFHNKGAAPWNAVIKLLEWGQEVRKTSDLCIISGNHDQIADQYESMGKTPYGVLVGSGIFRDISRRPYKVGDGPTLYGVPWPDGADPGAFKAIPQGVDVVIAHGFATPEGQERWGTHCHKYSDLALLAPHVKLWHFGHDHTDHGVFKLGNGAYVVNIGALSRGALDQDSLVRQVKTAIVMGDYADPVNNDGWHVTGVDQIALKTRPVEEIFDMAQYRERKAEQAKLEEYLANLQSGLENVLDVDYHSVLEQMALEAPVRERVREYIERAEAAATV